MERLLRTDNGKIIKSEKKLLLISQISLTEMKQLSLIEIYIKANKKTFE